MAIESDLTILNKIALQRLIEWSGFIGNMNRFNQASMKPHLPPMKKYPSLRRTCWLLILLLPVTHDVVAQEFRVAVLAYAGKQHAVNSWGPTIDYLNQTLPQHHFEMILYTSLNKQLDDARRKKFDFLLTNPSTYVELEASGDARAILTLINDRNGTAQTRFGSVIFTHIDHTDILQLRDLKGKNFMAVNRLAFGGWRVGLKVLQDHGIDPDADFASLLFDARQPDVVRAVLDKRVHAGMVRTDMLEQLAKKGDIDLRTVRILNQQSTPGFPFFHSSALYPEWPFAVMPETPPESAEQVKQTLLKISNTHPAALAGKYMGWTEALDYQPVRDLLRDVGVAPFAGHKTDMRLIFLLSGLSVLFVALYAFSRYSSKHGK